MFECSDDFSSCNEIVLGLYFRLAIVVTDARAAYVGYVEMDCCLYK
jgi:hypothetical protein